MLLFNIFRMFHTHLNMPHNIHLYLAVGKTEGSTLYIFLRNIYLLKYYFTCILIISQYFSLKVNRAEDICRWHLRKKQL